jgi:hypothetical protein
LIASSRSRRRGGIDQPTHQDSPLDPLKLAMAIVDIRAAMHARYASRAQARIFTNAN